jgi:hypothetical protein
MITRSDLTAEALFFEFSANHIVIRPSNGKVVKSSLASLSKSTPQRMFNYDHPPIGKTKGV